jgi:hypothetical protein
MPIDFVGDWCFDYRENNTTNYQLPSWRAEDAGCTKDKILSVNKWGFYYEQINCDPVRIQVSKDTAPSGTSYTAVIVARCIPDGPALQGILQTFKFDRYKGNMSVQTFKQ